MAGDGAGPTKRRHMRINFTACGDCLVINDGEREIVLMASSGQTGQASVGAITTTANRGSTISMAAVRNDDVPRWAHDVIRDAWQLPGERTLAGGHSKLRDALDDWWGGDNEGFKRVVTF